MLQAIQNRPRELTSVSHPVPAPQAAKRHVVYRTAGHRHGPVTRVFSPGDVGALTKPFIFLDYFDFVADGKGMFPMHPHSGIATTTILLSGRMRYEDTTGAAGILEAGGVEWFSAAGGAWHDAAPLEQGRFRGYQLWLALPPQHENSVPASQYLPPEEVSTEGPARIILGRNGRARSVVESPTGMHCVHVLLKAGERWSYAPLPGHRVAWAHVSRGALKLDDTHLENELAVFSESDEALDFTAVGPTEFILASAQKHPHDLVMGYYSVHTSAIALRQGETEIARVGEQLRASGRIG